MGSSNRPVTGLDHGISKGMVIHVGLVFSGHLDKERLLDAAGKVMEHYPELQVTLRRRLFSPGKYTTLPASKQAWDFKHRDWTDKSLAEIFPSAVRAFDDAAGSAEQITLLGAANTSGLNELFNFATPPINNVGIIAGPIMMFRMTTLGREEAAFTSLGLSVPHAVMDGQAVAEVLEAWGKVYSGQSLPKRVGELHPNLLSLLGPADDGGEAKGVVTPESQFRHGIFDSLKYIWDVWSVSSKGVEEQYLHIPHALITAMRDEARKLQGTTPESPVSSMDVFCAMMMKLFIRSSIVPKDRAFDLYYSYALFSSFPEESISRPYLHNFYTFGLFPSDSASDVASRSVPQLALQVRRRLEVLREPANVRKQLVFHDKHTGSINIVPRRDPKHGWGMISSWKEISDKARAGFAGENLVFFRPHLQFPFDLGVANVATPFGDGRGGLWARMNVTKGEWEEMWKGSDLQSLLST